MRVLMVSANTERINMPVLPVGMARVAAAAEQAGHDIRILNLMWSDQGVRELPRVVNGFAPEAIGVSVRNIDDQNQENPHFLLPPVKEVVDECRRLSSAPVILGGPGYSIFPHAVLAYLGADYGIQGEGEKAFPELLRSLESRSSIAEIPGLILPQMHSGPPPQSIRELDDCPLPQPGVHLQVPRQEDSEQFWVPFQTRRGCPMECSYCSTPGIEGRIMRRHSTEAAIKGLKAFRAAEYKRFFFVDNIFNLPPSYAERLCEGIVAAGLDISWQAIVYPSRLSQSLAKKMARAGCTGVSLGFESGSPRILAAMNKRFSPAEVRSVSDLLGEYDIFRMGFLLLGGPGETRSSVEESVSFVESLCLESVKLTPGIRIYPNTPLARQAREEGIIHPEADLLHPAFYLQPKLDGWLQERVAELIEQKPEWQI